MIPLNVLVVTEMSGAAMGAIGTIVIVGSILAVAWFDRWRFR